MKDADVDRLREASPDLKLDPLAMASKTKTDMSTKLQQKWNTKNLGLRLGADLASASSAAALVAPVISIIDR